MSGRDARSVVRAGVWRGNERAGTITRTATGSVFEYADAFPARRAPWDEGIALRLPYARRRFETSGVNLHPFFAGLLPEGMRLRAIVRLVKTSEDDLLSLLVASGGDVAGDVAVGPDDVAPSDAPPEADVDATSTIEFAELFARSLARLGDPGAGWSVAGVQPKVSAAMISFPVRAKGRGGAWLLKLDPPDVPRLVENEAFFLAAARDCGLTTPEFRLVRDRTGAAGLLVRRFDRAAGPPTRPTAMGIPTARRGRAGPVVRIHQEDACQLLDRYPADKYRLSMREIAEVLADCCSAPVLAVGWLIRLAAFSYAIGNGDLHAKNVSVRRDPATGRVEPTPAYDLVSTLPYGDERMALSLEGRDRNLRRRDFLAFGRRGGVLEPATSAILDDVVEGLAPQTTRLAEIGFDARTTRHLERTMAKRLDALR
jgi:serine/threonine-protein kinase HipA